MQVAALEETSTFTSVQCLHRFLVIVQVVILASLHKSLSWAVLRFCQVVLYQLADVSNFTNLLSFKYKKRCLATTIHVQ